MDVTGIKNLNAVMDAVDAYKRALTKTLGRSINESNIDSAIKGYKSSFKQYESAVDQKVKSIIEILDRLNSSISAVKSSYGKVANAAASSLSSSKNKLKS